MEKDLGGRPSKYLPAMNKQVLKLARLGATDIEMADFLEIAESTFHEWKKTYPKFSESLKRGKLQADANVADSLYSRAMGYSHPDVDIKVIDGDIVKTPLTKHYPPDTTAAIFWLKNRRGKVDPTAQRWADKQEITGDNGSPLAVPQMILVQPGDNSEIEIKEQE